MLPALAASACAHRRRSTRPRPPRCRACRHLTGDDLVRAGVKPLPQSADFKRADGSPTASPPQHALAVGTVRFVGEAVAAVDRRNAASQARDAAEAIDVRYEPLPLRRRPRRRACAGRAAGVAGGHRATSRANCATATPPRPLPRSRRRRMSSRSTSSTSASRPARSSRARRWPTTIRRPTASRSRVSCQTPTGLRDELCEAVLGIAQGQDARARGRRRRRLRHEDDALSRGRRRRVRHPRAQAAGEVVRRAHRGVPRRDPRPRPARARPSSRSTRTGGSSRCGSPRTRTSAPTRRRPASSSS